MEFNDDVDWKEVYRFLSQNAKHMISAGFYHSLFLTADGRVLATGHNEFDQLAFGNQNNTSIPQKIFDLYLW